jgi:alpha-ketoglutarate-dependent taurine dioxygenase
MAADPARADHSCAAETRAFQHDAMRTAGCPSARSGTSTGRSYARLQAFPPAVQQLAHRRKLRQLKTSFNPGIRGARTRCRAGAIYVNPQFTVSIRELKEDESSAPLHFLYSQAAVPEYQLRVKWEVDTVG